MQDRVVTRVNGPKTVSISGGDSIDVTEHILPSISKRCRSSDTGSHVKLIIISDSPNFSFIVSCDPLDIGINLDPALTNRNLVGDTLSPIEIIFTIYNKHLIFSGLDHLLTVFVGISWIDR